MLFVSKIRNLNLVRIPKTRVMDAERKVIPIPGKNAQFMNGRYETNDPDEIEWLIHHPQYRIEFLAIGESESQKIAENVKQLKVELNKELPTETESPVIITPTMDEIKALIQTEVSSALDEIKALLLATQTQQEPKEKKVFRCPICKEAFASGFDVGAHKKKVHSN